MLIAIQNNDNNFLTHSLTENIKITAKCTNRNEKHAKRHEQPKKRKHCQYSAYF